MTPTASDGGVAREVAAPPFHVVELSDIELELCGLIGMRCHADSIKRSDPITKAGQDAFGYEVAGKIGEVAVAKFFGLYYGWAFRSFKSKDGDVSGWEVKCPMGHDRNLIVKPNEPDDARFVLATCVPKSRHVRIHGWCWGHEARELGEKGTRYDPRSVLVKSSMLRRLPHRNCVCPGPG